MKKLFLVIITFVLIFPITVKADSAKSSIVIELNSGRILYANNINEERLIASITKIMTCIIAIEKGDLDKEVTAGDEILKMYGTSIYLELNEAMRLEDLLYGLMLRSGNDAAVVIANYIASSEEEFVKLMNEKAKELGMEHTVFNNAHGLDDETENYSTAYDMAILTRYALKNKEFRKIFGTSKYEVKTANKSYLWYNRVKLVSSNDACIGGKNGYTPRAGKTLVTAFKNNDLEIVIVTLKDSDEYNNHQELSKEIFTNYSMYEIVDKNDFDLVIDDKKYYVKESFSYPLTEEEKDKVRVLASIDEEIKKGKVGNIEITLEEETLAKIPIYIKEEKKKTGGILEFFKKLFS